jgi:Secretion system C-terminal sorting domain
MTNKKFKGNVFAKLMVALLPFGAAAQSIHIGSGARLIENDPVFLTLNNMGFINDGSFSASNGSTIQFTGTASATIATIGGSHFTGFPNIKVAKTTGDVMLNQDITLDGALTLTHGNLVLNGHNLTIGNSGIITAETEQASITSSNGGRVMVTRAIPANIATNPGNIGAELLISGADGSQTVLSVERTFFPEFLSNLNGTITSIDRGFTISSATNTSLNYGLRFFYLDKELDGNSADQLNLWTTVAPGSFIEIGRDTIDLRSKFVTKNLSGLGHFTLGNHLEGGIIQPDASIAGRVSGAGEINSMSVRVYPNPLHDKFRIDLFTPAARQTKFVLYDQSGHLLQQKEISCNAGANNLYWDMSNYAAGVYFIRVENTGLKSIRIVKE